MAKWGEQAAEDGNQRITAAYRYDIRGQLTEERDGDACTSYGYDSAGNRIWKKAQERETRYVYNEKNQLISEIWDQGKNTFTYDSQGSILEIAGTEKNLRFGYDSRNRQTRVIRSDGQSQENLYDAEGLRCGVKENGKLSRFAYHQGELLYERSEEREVSYHLGGGIEAARMGSELYYYHQDEQLSTALLTDAGGRVRNYYQYDAFGGMLAGEEGVSNRIRYTGQQYDEISEQYYLRARYYNPVVGRFLQEDVYEGDGLNLYAYCGNNPVRYYDPSGYAYDESKTGGDGGEGEKPEFGLDKTKAGESPWKPNDKKNSLWNKGKLKVHYEKHGDEFAVGSSKEYSDMAVEFGTRESDDIIQTVYEGYVYRYEPTTNTIFVGTEKGGKIKTFYVWDGRQDDHVITTLKSLGLIQ